MGGKVSCFDVVAKVAPNKNEFANRGAAVLTGATNGIGIPTTESLLLAGFDRVFVTARNENAANALVAGFKAKGLGDDVLAKLTVVSMDLKDLTTVKAAAERIDRESGEAGVSVLINNAGIMAEPYGHTAQGFELQIGVNHFGHCLFTDVLLPALRRSGAITDGRSAGDVARLVFVSSEAHKMGPGPVGFDETTFEYDAGKTGGYSRWTAYGQSKLSNVLAALDYDETFKANKEPVAAMSLHPGVIKTGLGNTVGGIGAFHVLGAPFLKNVDQGAATSIYCALAKDALTHRGGYFKDAKFEGAIPKGQDTASAKTLMAETRRLLEHKMDEVEMKDAKK